MQDGPARPGENSPWCAVAGDPSLEDKSPHPDQKAEGDGPGAKASPALGALDRTRLGLGIGASAGGSDAPKTFFSAVPADIGMAFVIVQHLDPNYESSLAAIIAACATLPVHVADDGMPVGPNQIFVIPPDAILTIKGGLLRVARPAPPSARRV